MEELTLDEIDLKLITLKLYKIKVLITLGRFRIETNSKQIYLGTLQPSERNGSVYIVTDDLARVETEITDLYKIFPLEKSFFTRLNGTLSAGFSYTRSSTEGQVNLSSNINYTTRRVDYQFLASENASLDSSGFSRDREQLSVQAAYNVTPAWFAVTSSTYQRNLELSIARRYQLLFGGGRKLLLKRSWQLLALTGITLNQEKSTSNESSGLLFEVPMGIKFDYFKFHHPDIQISSQPALYFSLTQKGRTRFDGNTNFSWQLIRYFYLTINPYFNYDSQPPEGNSNLDYGIVVSISYKF